MSSHSARGVAALAARRYHNIEWSLKPMTVWMKLFTGTAIDYDGGQRTLSAYFLLFYKFILLSATIAHVSALSIQHFQCIRDIHAKNVSKESINSTVMTGFISETIETIDNSLFLIGIRVSFFVVSLTRIGDAWVAMLRIEQQMALTAATYKTIRKIALWGIVMIITVLTLKSLEYIACQSCISRSTRSVAFRYQSAFLWRRRIMVCRP